MKMNKFIFMFFALPILVCACVDESESLYVESVAYTESEISDKIYQFENDYIEANQIQMTRSSSTSPIKLIGYTTISYHGEDSIFVNNLWQYAQEEIKESGSFLPLDGKVRVYCSMRDAIVKYNGKTYVADSLGQIYDFPIDKIESIKVCGREKSNHSIYTKFKVKLAPSKIYENQNVLIFDLGIKEKSAPSLILTKSRVRSRTESSDDGKVSCVKNHLPSRNCTEAFDCSQGRCTTLFDRCMDYNGFGTDCSGSHLYFLGSDCSVAMASGHCWNEIM